jgi:putative MATE family efflux protein
LGAAAVAAVSVSFPFMFLVIALGAGLGIAGATLSAQYMGAGRQDMVNHVAAQTMMMVAVTSAVLGTAGYALAPWLLDLLGVAPDVYIGALGFMQVSFIGIIFVFLYGMFQALMRGVGETRTPLLIVLGTMVLNFLLDPLFIFGLGPLPSQGVMGAALATQGLAALLGIVIFLRGRHGIQLSWRGFRPDPPYIKRAFMLGLPGSIELATRGLGPMLLWFLVAGFGTVTLAGYGVGSNILQFVTIPAMGMSQAVSTLVSRNTGAGNTQRAARITLLGASFGILSIVGLIAYVLAPALVAFFVPRAPEVIAEGAQFIRITCPGMGRHRRAAMRGGRLPRLRQHAGGDGDRAGLPVRAAVSAGLYSFQTYDLAGFGSVVVVSGHNNRGRRCLGLLVRAGRLESDGADGREQAGREGGGRNGCRGGHPLSAVFAVGFCTAFGLRSVERYSASPEVLLPSSRVF